MRRALQDITKGETKQTKVGLIYISTTPELIQLTEQEVIKQLGSDVELLSLKDAPILAEVREVGYVTIVPAAGLIGMYMKVAEAGMDAMLNLCSSMGEVADCAQDAARYLGVSTVRVDEEMCQEVVRKGQKIAVTATLPTTLESIKDATNRVARKMGRHVELVDVLVDGGFGLDQEQLKALMAEYAGKVAEDVDVILFAQDSMIYCEEYIADVYHKIALSSPHFRAMALKEALVAKGVMQLKTYN